MLVDWDTTELEAYEHQHPVTGQKDVASHPSTPLLIMTGPYQGSAVGSTGRAVICTRFPLTDVYLDTYFGGDFGHDLRQAGWEGLFIFGKALILYALKSMIWKQNWLSQSRCAVSPPGHVNRL